MPARRGDAARIAVAARNRDEGADRLGLCGYGRQCHGDRERRRYEEGGACHRKPLWLPERADCKGKLSLWEPGCKPVVEARGAPAGPTAKWLAALLRVRAAVHGPKGRLLRASIWSR